MKLILRKTIASAGVMSSRIHFHNGKGVIGRRFVLQNVAAVGFDTESHVGLAGGRVANRSFMSGSSISDINGYDIAGVVVK